MATDLFAPLVYFNNCCSNTRFGGAQQVGDKVQAAVLEMGSERGILQRSTAIRPIQGDELNFAISLVY